MNIPSRLGEHMVATYVYEHVYEHVYEPNYGHVNEHGLGFSVRRRTPCCKCNQQTPRFVSML